MKIILLILVFINSLFSLAQNNVVVTDVKPYNINKNRPEYEAYHFPEIKHPDKKVADKINTFLQIEYLEHIPGVFKKHPFEKVCYDQNDRNRSNTSFDGWKKFTSPKNILSLKIEGEANGAYPENFDNYRNFDLTTGNPILLKNLLLSTKIGALNELLKQKVDAEIKDFLKEIKDSLANPKIIGEERERYGEQDTLYHDCLRDHTEMTINYYEYYFTKDSITFVLGRCSNHAMRAIDDLYDFHIPITYKDFKEYLSSYGKSLLDSNNSTTLQLYNPDGKIFKGTIGNIPITLIINDEINEDGSFDSKYWYDKQKIPIDLSSSFIDGHFSFKEYDEFHSVRATLEANWDNNSKIVGTWRDTKTGKTLKLLLETY